MTKRSPITSFAHKGFSLVEILVAMAIGFMLLTGIMQVYISNYTATGMISGLASQQENSRVALNKLTRSLRLAGHYGAVDGEDINVVGGLSITGSGSCNHTWAIDTEEPLRGFEGASAISGVTNLPSGCIESDNYVPDSDILVVRYASASGIAPINALTSSQIYLRTAITGGISGGEILLGSDISASSIGGGADGVGIYNYTYRTELYYLRPCSELNGTECSDGNHSLVRMSLDDSTFVSQSVAEGVEQFQVVYGIDNNADYIADEYVSASGVSDWNVVVSAQFSVVIRSQQPDNNYRDTNSYSLVGDYTYTPDTSVTKHRRKTYTRVVQLRNMSRG